MKNSAVFSEFPERIRASTERPQLWYVRMPGHYAIHGQVPAQVQPSVLQYLNDRSIAICGGDPDWELSHSQSLILTPIYSLEPNGPPAVPTGLVFVRFREGIRSEGQLSSLTSIGYMIVVTPEYATHTAWVRHVSGEIVKSLAHIPALETLPHVINVEPQMLTKRISRIVSTR